MIGKIVRKSCRQLQLQVFLLSFSISLAFSLSPSQSLCCVCICNPLFISRGSAGRLIMPGKRVREKEITYVPETKRTKGNGDRERIGSYRVLALVRLIRRLRLRLTLTLTPTQQRSKRRRWIRATHTDRPEMHTHTHTRTRTNTHAQRILWFYRQILNLLAAGLSVFSLFLAHRLWALLNCTSWDDTMTIFDYRYLRLFLLFVFVFGKRQHDDDEGEMRGKHSRSVFLLIK